MGRQLMRMSFPIATSVLEGQSWEVGVVDFYRRVDFYWHVSTEHRCDAPCAPHAFAIYSPATYRAEPISQESPTKLENPRHNLS